MHPLSPTLDPSLKESASKEVAGKESASMEIGASFQHFLGGQIFFFIFSATGQMKNWKKQHFICIVI